ncbi:hypothetical protein STRAU_5899 [Streptomyces aurantiacus JA 4570]|uniref:Type I-E CRISPR-associated protein Cas6/Cse3/CasE n=1 Tax=Streptomyces aurantiacus JA 4570 TaxID=1286094 RepID=S3ZBD2_9ACTN|nr:type I-E CRISPR-associated protein Cas6/Cse3/CasE [Streptomyces aurantiacus]EPH41021.1 hypothetical protein STRAU_5899 [Streptomyces aurantiacus JA 4570]
MNTARVIAHHTACQLDLNHPDIARAVLDPHDMHRLVMRPFRHWVPDGTPSSRAQMGILHTETVSLATNTLTLVIQSRVPGDWTALPASAHITPPHTMTLDLTIHTGQHYRFRTVINPARYTTRVTGPRHRTRSGPADASPSQALMWFTSRLQPQGTPDYDRYPRIGADTTPNALTARTLPTLTSTTRGFRLNRAEIQGHLTITDPTTFANTLIHGLGRSRPYGCGLLLAQPTHITEQQKPTETPAQEGSSPRARV